MKRAGLLASAVLVIAGIAAMSSVVVANRKAARANDWNQVRATVERVDGGTVAYRYEAGGTEQRGTAPARPGAIYTVGGPVLAYVNPADPAESLLDLPPRPATWPTTFGVVALIVGAGVGYWAWQESRPKAGAPAPTPPKGTKVAGDTTSRRKAPPLARLQPPPGAKWKRGEEENPSPQPPPP